jgi:nicotinic acid mononucleotide adenylyltransferase
VVCVSRDGAGQDAAAALAGSALLARHRGSVVFTQDPVPNEVSSALVRRQLEAGRTAKYLLPDPVLQYIASQGVYPKPRR